MHRAGVVAVVAAGAVVGVVTPASADVTGLSAEAVADFHPGETHQLKIHASGTGSGTIQLSGLTSDFDVTPATGCKQPPDSSTSCNFTFTVPAGRKHITFTITAHQNVSVGTGQSTTIQVTATGDGQTTNANFKLFGATATQGPNTVAQVNGTVKDGDTGQPIAGAIVGLQDSASPPHTYNSTTDAAGRYTFRGSAANPIVPGIIAVDATKDGYKSATKNATVQAGQTINFTPITLTSTATPTAVPSAADPAAGASTGTDSAAAAPPATTDVAKNGSSGFSTLLIVLGAALVLLGIGAIVFILVRRRRDDGEGPDEADETGAPQRGPTPVPAS